LSFVRYFHFLTLSTHLQSHLSLCDPIWHEWWGAGVVICLERCADLHMAQLMPLPLTVSCFSKIQIVFLPFWYWLTCVVPDKGPLNVCVYVIPYGMQVPVAVWQPCKLIFMHFSPLKDFGILFLNYYVLSLLIFTNVSTTCKVYLRVSPIICKIVILKAT